MNNKLEPLPKPDYSRAIQFGEYTTAPWEEGSIWVENSEGEGMPMDEKTFYKLTEQMLGRWFTKNF